MLLLVIALVIVAIFEFLLLLKLSARVANAERTIHESCDAIKELREGKHESTICLTTNPCPACGHKCTLDASNDEEKP
jgi:anaerobic selenocysteine-containing dehydrogenase